MKISFSAYLLGATCAVLLAGCPGPKPVEDNPAYTYTVDVQSATKSNAPALQSFVHGVSGNEWLLFGGRTNGGGDSLLGGLHDLNANYTNKSFLPASFNQNVYVYDVEKDVTVSVSVAQLVAALQKLDPGVADSLFVKTNPEVYQVGTTLYVVGGYGPDPQDFDGPDYRTYGDLLMINVPEMIALVKLLHSGGDAAAADKYKDGSLFLFRRGSLLDLQVTGGEVFVYQETLYVAGGWNFYKGASGDPYTCAVRCFTTSNDGSFGVKATSCGSISDGQPIDSSIFRRRDAPFVAAVYQDGSGALQPGISIYAGVFQAGENPLPWSTAIYVHPTFKNTAGAQYAYDQNYNQGSQNVYACADFVGYDSGTDTLHTFLLGGIGDGGLGFTNSALHVRLNTKTLLSSPPAVTPNVMPGGTSFFGAESALILDANLKLVTASGSETEVIDLQTAFKEGNNTLNIGYVYGGIQALQANPGTFGPGNSGASNQVFQVRLVRTAITKS